MAVTVITLDDVDVTPVVLFSSARFESQVNGKGGACHFRIRDEAGTASYQAGARIALTIDGDAVWSGYALSIKRVYVFPAINVPAFGTTRFFDIEGVDLNVLFTRRIVFNQAEPADVFGTLFPVGTADITAIEDLLADFLDLTGDDLDTTSGVTNVGDINVDQEARAWSGSNTWGQAMASIGRIPGAIFYLHPNRTLIYTDDETVTAPFGLSDQPDGVSAKGYREAEWLIDGSGLANDVFGWGIGYGSDRPIFKRITDGDSVDAHGLWQQAGTYFGTFKQATLDRNVESVIYGSPTNLRGAKDDRPAVTLTTFHPGLLPAMKVEFEMRVFSSASVALPIRKMLVTFPTPETPKYELTLSHEIDTPFGLIDDLLFNIKIPKVPPIPPIKDPVPPPPAPISCGITDTYNRATTDFEDNALGIADCGRSYVSGWQGIQGNRGESLGPFHADLPSSPLETSWVMGGPWPVPFSGSIVLANADTFPGFTAVTDPSQPYPTGWSWAGGNVGTTYFDGSSAVCLPFGGIAIGHGVTPFAGEVYIAEEPLEITGHFRVIETVDANGLELDDYIDITLGVDSVQPDGGVFPEGALIYPIGTPGDGRTELGFPGFYPSSAPCEFPAHFWRDNPAGVDFSITWPGGYGDYTGGAPGKLVTITVGPCTVSVNIWAGQRIMPNFGISNRSAWDDDPDNTYATLYVDDPVTFNDLTVDAPFSCLWRVTNAYDVDGHELLYEFAYLGYGGFWPGFPDEHDTGVVPFGDYASPGLVGPYIAVRITDITADSYAVAWAPVSALAFPAIPYMEADSFAARLTLGGVTVTALPANAVDRVTGDPAPMGLLLEIQGDLSQRVWTNQGTYFAYDDLNIIGVNACTLGFINSDGNWLSVFFTGDGSKTIFQLPGPFLPGTAAVYVDGVRQRQVVDYIENPVAGTIMLATAPAFGTTIVVSYFPAPAVVPGPGPVPGPPPPPGSRPWAAPVTTATYLLSDTSIDATGASDVSAAMIAFIDSVPDGSIIDFDINGGVYRMASGGLLFQQHSNLDVRGNGWTTIRISGNGNDEARSAFLMRASDHIKIGGFTVIADGVSITASEGEAAHALGISGYFALGESSYIEMANVVASHLKGDGVYIEGSNGGAFPPSHHVWVSDCSFDYMGRNGVSFINCTDVLIESNTFDHVSYHAVDFEANFAAEECTDITVRNNSFGSYAHRANLLGYFVADVPLGAGSVTSFVLIDGNTVEGIGANGYNGTPRGLDSKFIGDGYPPNGTTRHDNITFTNNSTPRARSGAIVVGHKIDTFVVTGNTQPLSSGGFVSTSDCTGVVDTPNDTAPA